MKPNLIRENFTRRLFSRLAPIALCSLVLATAQAQSIQWGLTLTNIKNPITPIVVTNGDGSLHRYKEGPDERYTRNEHWRPEIQRLLNDYFPQRTEAFLNILERRGLWPPLANSMGR